MVTTTHCLGTGHVELLNWEIHAYSNVPNSLHMASRYMYGYYYCSNNNNNNNNNNYYYYYYKVAKAIKAAFVIVEKFLASRPWSSVKSLFRRSRFSEDPLSLTGNP